MVAIRNAKGIKNTPGASNKKAIRENIGIP